MGTYDDLSLSEIHQAILDNCSASVTLDSRTDLSDREKEVYREGLNINLQNLLKRKKFLQGGYVTQRTYSPTK